jgi:hypothetical protein
MTMNILLTRPRLVYQPLSEFSNHLDPHPKTGPAKNEVFWLDQFSGEVSTLIL